ncbi:MAG TPA: type 1 glutamine amidotransferase [Bacteroidetes bacterium]|nr:type 1 glutamine amidotransferase [Bacteroidota bacterium]
MSVSGPHLLVVQHSTPEDLGSFASVLRDANGRATVVHSHEGQALPQSLEEFDAVVLMGGPMGVYEEQRYPFLLSELKLLENAFRVDIPVLGVCLGSQLIARALGAEVKPRAQKEIGWYDLRLTEDGKLDPLFDGFPAQFTGFHWHGDVFDLPKSSVRLASSDLTRTQAFRYGSKVYGLLFHLEMTAEIAAEMARLFHDELLEAGVSEEDVLNGFERHGETLQHLGRTFFSRWLALADK